MSSAHRLERLTEATVEGLVGDLAALGAGRTAALLVAAGRLGAMVREGLVLEDDALERLLAASEANGSIRKRGRREILSTIRRGLRRGLERFDLDPAIDDAARAILTAPRALPVAPPRLRAAPSPARPPAPTLEHLLALTRPVLEDLEVAGFLARRRLDAIAVADGDLARALPLEAHVPHWAWSRAGTWPSSGHRLLVPLVDELGAVRSILARDVTGNAHRKSLAPSGFERRGLVMACGLARRMLAGLEAPARLVITEGEVDFLAAAAGISDADEAAPAILGIVAGSWTDELAARVPDGAEVVIATDHDTDGEKYARRIVDTFAGRNVELARWRPNA